MLRGHRNSRRRERHSRLHHLYGVGKAPGFRLSDSLFYPFLHLLQKAIFFLSGFQVRIVFQRKPPGTKEIDRFRDQIVVGRVRNGKSRKRNRA